MDASILNIIVFYIAAALAVGGAFMMVWQKNPVASAMFLILSLLSQAVLYIQLDAVFVSALLIIVYAGAIVTLFLFVIMLLNLRGEQFVDRSSGFSRIGKLVAVGLIGGEMIYIITQSVLPTFSFGELGVETFGDVKSVASLLYSKYLFAFEATSILLLVAIVGAVILARRANGESEAPEAPEALDAPGAPGKQKKTGASES